MGPGLSPGHPSSLLPGSFLLFYLIFFGVCLCLSLCVLRLEDNFAGPSGASALII